MNTKEIAEAYLNGHFNSKYDQFDVDGLAKRIDEALASGGGKEPTFATLLRTEQVTTHVWGPGGSEVSFHTATGRRVDVKIACGSDPAETAKYVLSTPHGVRYRYFRMTLTEVSEEEANLEIFPK